MRQSGASEGWLGSAEVSRIFRTVDAELVADGQGEVRVRLDAPDEQSRPSFRSFAAVAFIANGLSGRSAGVGEVGEFVIDVRIVGGHLCNFGRGQAKSGLPGDDAGVKGGVPSSVVLIPGGYEVISCHNMLFSLVFWLVLVCFAR
jgi:hypothetical protein